MLNSTGFYLDFSQLASSDKVLYLDAVLTGKEISMDKTQFFFFFFYFDRGKHYYLYRMILYRAKDLDMQSTPMGINANYLDMIADIHFCSSVLCSLVTMVRKKVQ